MPFVLSKSLFSFTFPHQIRHHGRVGFSVLSTGQGPVSFHRHREGLAQCAFYLQDHDPWSRSGEGLFILYYFVVLYLTDESLNYFSETFR